MIWNAIILALAAIRRNVMRSTLTVLGIVIGVAAVIVMVHLGNGATASVASGRPQYPSNITCGRCGRHTISPTSPGATSCIASSTTRVSTFSTGRPQEPGLRAWSSGPSMVASGAISVWP